MINKINRNLIVEKLTLFLDILIKFFKRYWIYITLSIFIFLFFINKMISIVLGLVFVFALIIYYLITSNLRFTLIKYMRNFDIVDDQKVSEELLVPLDEVRKCMRMISKKVKKKQWIIVCINNRCIFYNIDLINKFIEFYNNGLTEKSIFNALVKEFPIRSRAEIKAIEDKLHNQERIEIREFSTKLLSYESKLIKK